MSIETIHRYTGQNITFAALREAGRLGELTNGVAHQLADLDGQLRSRAAHLRRAAGRVDAALDATDPGEQRLNELGEVQAYGLDTDRLIALRHLQIGWLRELVTLLIEQPVPADAAADASSTPARGRVWRCPGCGHPFDDSDADMIAEHVRHHCDNVDGAGRPPAGDATGDDQ